MNISMKTIEEFSPHLAGLLPDIENDPINEIIGKIAFTVIFGFTPLVFAVLYDKVFLPVIDRSLESLAELFEYAMALDVQANWKTIEYSVELKFEDPVETINDKKTTADIKISRAKQTLSKYTNLAKNAMRKST